MIRVAGETLALSPPLIASEAQIARFSKSRTRDPGRGLATVSATVRPA